MTKENQNVDLDAGNSFSAFAHKINQASYKNSPFVIVRESDVGGFRSSKGWRYTGLPDDVWYTGGMDGIGTKVLITDAAGLYQYSAGDLMAMTATDITRKGGRPLIFMNVLNVAALEGENMIRAKQLMQGLGNYAKENGIVLFNGETAELKGLALADSSPKLSYLWESAAVGVFRESTEITGKSIRPGQVVVVFEDKSPGSNGITELRRGLAEMYSVSGFDWWSNPNGKEDVMSAAMPCTQYDKFLTYLNGWDQKDFEPVIKLNGIAHISGGGIPDKLAGDLLFSQGYGATLNNLFSPPEIFQKVAKARRNSHLNKNDYDYLKMLYNNWHSGQRLIVVVEEKDVNDLLYCAGHMFDLIGKVAGKITDKPILEIDSNYEIGKGVKISYTPEDLVRD